MAGPRQFKTPSGKHVGYVSKASIVMTSTTRIEKIRYLLAIHPMSSAKQLKDFNETGHITISILPTNVSIFLVFQSNPRRKDTLSTATLVNCFWETLSTWPSFLNLSHHTKDWCSYCTFSIKKKASRHPRAPGSLSGGRRMISSKLLMSSRPSEIQERKITSTSTCYLTVLPRPVFTQKKSNTYFIIFCTNAA